MAPSPFFCVCRMAVSCHPTTSTSSLHFGSGIRPTPLSLAVKVFVELKPQSAVSFGVPRPNSNFAFQTKVHSNIQSWPRDREETPGRITMMPTGSPQVPVKVPGEKIVQFLDVSNALFRERIILIGSYIEEEFSTYLQLMILYLDNIGTSEPLMFFINSPGGDAIPTLSIFDTMQSLQSPVATRCLGSAVNHAGFLLAAGDKGNRSALPMSRIMLQSPAGSVSGQADYMRNETNELLRIRDRVFNQLASMTGQPVEKIYEDLKWPKSFTAEEAVEYGLIDRVVERRQEKKKFLQSVVV